MLRDRALDGLAQLSKTQKGAAPLLAQTLFSIQKKSKKTIKLVFAESCTGGLCAALLAQTPGISKHLCGSMEVYQLDTKTKWLGVNSPPSKMGVSQEITEKLATQILKETPHAHFSLAVTGFLTGPIRDGEIWISVSQRVRGKIKPVATIGLNLGRSSKKTSATDRIRRQKLVAETALTLLRHLVSERDFRRSSPRKS